MVYNSTKHIKLPFSNAKFHSATSRIVKPVGTGTGSVLLRTGGAGGASSYSDMDDYIRTTGINPYSRKDSVRLKPTGGGLKSLTSKLEKLNVIPSQLKNKKITMSF